MNKFSIFFSSNFWNDDLWTNFIVGHIECSLELEQHLNRRQFCLHILTAMFLKIFKINDHNCWYHNKEKEIVEEYFERKKVFSFHWIWINFVHNKLKCKSTYNCPRYKFWFVFIYWIWLWLTFAPKFYVDLHGNEGQKDIWKNNRECYPSCYAWN